MKNLFIVDFTNIFIIYSSKIAKSENILPFVINYLQNLSNNLNNNFIFIYDGKPIQKLKIYPRYKQNRIKIENQKFQFIFETKKLFIEFLKKIGINYLFFNDLEADDLIAYCTHSLSNYKISIISNDYDFVQLVKPNTKLITRNFIFGLNQETDRFYLSQRFLKSIGYLYPGNCFQIFKILNGDKSDNISSCLIPYRKSKILQEIFSEKNKNILLEFNQINDFNFDDFKTFIKKLNIQNLINLDSAELNYKLLSLSFNNIKNYVNNINLNKYIISSIDLNSKILTKNLLWKI